MLKGIKPSVVLVLMLRVGRVVRSNGRIDADLEPESININYFEIHTNTAKTLLYGYLFGGPPPPKQVDGIPSYFSLISGTILAA